MGFDKILSLSPLVEVSVKYVYWKFAFVNSLLSKVARQSRKSAAIVAEATNSVSFERVVKKCEELGVNKGSIVIVHSSAVALQGTGLTPTQICEALIDYVGPDGTLAMPAFPLYREESKGTDRLSDDICAKEIVYDVRKTPSWTGALPKALMKIPGAIRSRHPLNSMVAVGREAEEMMRRNIDGESPKPCGPQSSWKYCADHGASIVFLGVDAAHSITMIHVAEDCRAEGWPIHDWYRNRNFYVRDGAFEAKVKVLERRPKWSINYAERTLQKDLIRFGVLRTGVVDGVRVEVCDSARLIEFLESKNGRGYPYWIPFWLRG